MVVRPGSGSGAAPGPCLHPGGHRWAVSTGGRCRCLLGLRELLATAPQQDSASSAEVAVEQPDGGRRCRLEGKSRRPRRAEPLLGPRKPPASSRCRGRERFAPAPHRGIGWPSSWHRREEQCCRLSCFVAQGSRAAGQFEGRPAHGRAPVPRQVRVFPADVVAVRLIRRGDCRAPASSLACVSATVPRSVGRRRREEAPWEHGQHLASALRRAVDTGRRSRQR